MDHSVAVKQLEEQFAKMSDYHSDCKRKTTGCRIVYPAEHAQGLFRIVGSAVNGPAKGHVCTNEVGNCGCMHAEMQAIMGARNYAILVKRSFDDCSLLSDYSPCTNCANIITLNNMYLGLYYVSVRTVIYRIHTDHDPRGNNILRNSGVKVLQLAVVQRAPEASLDHISAWK